MRQFTGPLTANNKRRGAIRGQGQRLLERVQARSVSV